MTSHIFWQWCHEDRYTVTDVSEELAASMFRVLQNWIPFQCQLWIRQVPPNCWHEPVTLNNVKTHKTTIWTLNTPLPRVKLKKNYTNTGRLPYPQIQYPWFTAARKNLENYRNTWFISFKMHAKREQAVTWWNPAAKTRPILDSPSSVPVPTVPC
jgi:hypothetical protein